MPLCCSNSPISVAAGSISANVLAQYIGKTPLFAGTSFCAASGILSCTAASILLITRLGRCGNSAAVCMFGRLAPQPYIILPELVRLLEMMMLRWN